MLGRRNHHELLVLLAYDTRCSSYPMLSALLSALNSTTSRDGSFVSGSQIALVTCYRFHVSYLNSTLSGKKVVGYRADLGLGLLRVSLHLNMEASPGSAIRLLRLKNDAWMSNYSYFFT